MFMCVDFDSEFLYKLLIYYELEFGNILILGIHQSVHTNEPFFEIEGRPCCMILHPFLACPSKYMYFIIFVHSLSY